MDALLEASRRTRLLITTHSPDLLEHSGLDISSILAVEARDNEAIITPVRPEMRETVRQHLYTVEELLRQDQLQPDERMCQQMRAQLQLFPGNGVTRRGARSHR